MTSSSSKNTIVDADFKGIIPPLLLNLLRILMFKGFCQILLIMFQCSIVFTILDSMQPNMEDFWHIVLWFNCDVRFTGPTRNGVDKLSWPADFPAMASNPPPSEKWRQVPNRWRRILKIHMVKPSQSRGVARSVS